ncbi:MAG: hypothetical protein BWZ08_02796 [candidate division BRC1 bacterium ADurb.BinA292]|nr:MAG: hypothetical protein BWZ08_02796 [candidate division BRC1 bacterium ADurb.BinA292]
MLNGAASPSTSSCLAAMIGYVSLSAQSAANRPIRSMQPDSISAPSTTSRRVRNFDSGMDRMDGKLGLPGPGIAS